MKKNTIKLTESQLRTAIQKTIKESLENDKLSESNNYSTPINESELAKLITEAISNVLSENYPLGAEYDPRAPWNEPEEPDVDDEILEKVNEEIDTLSDEFGEWLYWEYCDDNGRERMDNYETDEEYENIEREYSKNSDVREKYYNYRYEDIKEDILNNYEEYEPDYDKEEYWYRNRMDEAAWYSDEGIENGARKLANFIIKGFKRMGEKFIEGLEPEVKQAWDDGKNGRPCASKGLTAATIAYQIASDIYGDEPQFDD